MEKMAASVARVSSGSKFSFILLLPLEGYLHHGPLLLLSRLPSRDAINRFERPTAANPPELP
jgi:hypothetical protein